MKLRLPKINEIWKSYDFDYKILEIKNYAISLNNIYNKHNSVNVYKWIKRYNWIPEL